MHFDVDMVDSREIVLGLGGEPNGLTSHNLPVACAVWEPKPEFATSAEAWILAGGPHHTVLSTAVGTPEFRDLAGILSTELVVIDDSTTIPTVQNELRWSAAYHRLAGRL